MAGDGAETRVSAADEWFARLHSGEATSQDKAEFARWKLSDENHGKGFGEVEALWDKSGNVADDPAILALRQSVKAGLEGQKHSAGLWLKRWQAVAAVFAVAAITALAYFAVPARTPEARLFAAATGEQKIITLEDGSVITLDTASRVEVAYSAASRQVDLLEGRARFKVADVPDQPFVVKADGGTIRALGTAFDVSRRADAILVTLLEGKVEVKAGAVAQLAPGEQISYDSRGALTPASVVNLAAVASWAEGRLVFDGIPLSLALSEVNRYAEQKIILTDATLGAKRFRGTFNTGDTLSVVQALSHLYGLEVADQNSAEIKLVMAK